jgi:predicted benzoate:H+ symporter BenE
MVVVVVGGALPNVTCPSFHNASLVKISLPLCLLLLRGWHW